ncbi:sulfatase-like hydrolase/transferase, partial [Mariniblastus sp.]|nr:sulfatase-like hydrolase/transferase [Mariniblastus sp.]
MILRTLLVLLTFCFGFPNSASLATQPNSDRSPVEPPNIVFIMSDELAYYELSHMGNPYIRTPNIDQMAAEGIRFTQALAAAPVCAPLRGALMTGKHMGHASIRANGGGTPLRADEVTIASLLKQQNF